MTVRASELERAAEQTIAAAATALVWAGGDGHEVLAHVAAADRQLMAGTRLVYEHETVHLDPSTGRGLRGFADLREIYRTTTTLFEVAALPRLVAPEWTAQVLAAMRRPTRDHGDLGASASQAVQDYALYICSLWGRENIDIDKITDWADAVSSSTEWCWRLANSQR